MEIDFDYIYYIAMNRLGFSFKEAGRLYFGKFVDMFEVHKRIYNFETKRCLYATDEPKQVAKLSEL